MYVIYPKLHLTSHSYKMLVCYKMFQQQGLFQEVLPPNFFASFILCNCWEIQTMQDIIAMVTIAIVLFYRILIYLMNINSSLYGNQNIRGCRQMY